MENGARVIKGFILSVPESVSRLCHRAGQLESQFRCFLLQSAISATRHELYMAYIFFCQCLYLFFVTRLPFACWKVLKFNVITVLSITIDQYNIICATQTFYGLASFNWRI